MNCSNLKKYIVWGSPEICVGESGRLIQLDPSLLDILPVLAN
jgi:hypothetical protein